MGEIPKGHPLLLGSGDSAATLAKSPEFLKHFAAERSGTLFGALQQLIDDLPEQIALLDEDCNILGANRAWKETVERHGYVEALPGRNYRDFCAAKAAEGYQPAIEAVAALEDIVSGKLSFWQFAYNGQERWDGHDFQICFHPIDDGGQRFILVTRFDLTEILELRRLKEEFSNVLIEGQALERQRMARELHDSTSQLLTGIGLVLGRLEHQFGEDSLGLIAELRELVREAQQEIRSISYLAHPPALDKMGLAEALKSLVEGFGRRTSLEASFEIQGDTAALSAVSEGALYRMAQEGLSNVHRHAHATRVHVLLCFRAGATHLMVADNGVGISPETLCGAGNAGVGLASMRARLSDIGGRLSVRNLRPGTAIVATLVERRPQLATQTDLTLADLC